MRSFQKTSLLLDVNNRFVACMKYNDIIITENHCRSYTTITQAKKFARQFPQLARQALKVPPYTANNINEDNKLWSSHLSSNGLISLDQYLKWRNWDLAITSKSPPNDIVTSAKQGKHKNKYAKEMMISLVSHTLTYPLTLADNLEDCFFHLKSKNDNSISNNRLLRLGCIGARAEATLPLDYWREMLIYFWAKTTTNSRSMNIDGLCLKREWNFVIDFIGPDVQLINLQPRSTSIKLPGGNGVCWTLTLNNHKNLLHHAIDKELKSTCWDGFVLFNPGIGHKSLKDIWKPTVDILKEQNKPTLLTAHSNFDAERDLQLLLQEQNKEGKFDENEWNCYNHYRPNNFASQLYFEDPLVTRKLSDNENTKTLSNHLVRPNHAILYHKKNDDI